MVLVTNAGAWKDESKRKTKFLSNLLEQEKLNQRGHYWASEVCLDYGTKNVTRVDYLEFSLVGQIDVSDIEKGFIPCVIMRPEKRSCKKRMVYTWAYMYS